MSLPPRETVDRTQQPHAGWLPLRRVPSNAMLFPRIKVLRFRLFVLILCAAMLCQSCSYLWFTNSSFKCHSHFISLCHQYFQPQGLFINPQRWCRLLAHAPRFSFPDPFLSEKKEKKKSYFPTDGKDLRKVRLPAAGEMLCTIFGPSSG